MGTSANACGYGLLALGHDSMSYFYLGVAFVVTAVLGFTCLIALQRVVG